MRKFIVIVVVALVVLCGVSLYVYKTDKVSKTYEIKESKNANNMLSMMLETSAGSGEYKETTSNTWPGDGYVFNSTLSKCKNGSNLNWDNDKKQVIFDGINKDECYVYFDKEPLYLYKYIKKLYTGVQGENNLYYHDSSLTNGAGDNSYRYAGSSDTTNNFVCFGYDSKDGSCPTDYLYRIIGVFAEEVKLIKYDCVISTLLGTDGDYGGSSTPSAKYYKGNLTKTDVYYWNYSNKDKSINTWSESRLNTVNLNTNYLNNIGTSWSNKIAMHIWKLGGNTYNNIVRATAHNIYVNEITSPAENTTYDAKVGLMYTSDYGYAAAPSAWNTTLLNYDESSVTGVNWMYMGLLEWVITPQSDSGFAYFIYHYGSVNYDTVYISLDVRPVFYLNSNVSYVSGSGTKENPILIN